jgi:hypothetical protein
VPGRGALAIPRPERYTCGVAMRTGDFQTGAMRAASILHRPEELEVELLLFLGEADTLGVMLGRGETQASARLARAARYSST